jgi:hypothetical protein
MMIYRLLSVLVVAAVLAVVINSIPDIKRYIELRKM